MVNNIEKAASLIKNAKFLTAFTGAGISAESGIPPFRGENGIWNQYDPQVLSIDYFLANPLQSWTVIRKLFYEMFNEAVPNAAHRVLAEWQHSGMLQCLITQNIDQLHQNAGSQDVVCFHGTSTELVCLQCQQRFAVSETLLATLPPLCPQCSGLLKPDFIFFGEGIPPQAYERAFEAAEKTDVMLIIGTSGEVSPANYVPFAAKQHGCTFIEINRDISRYTHELPTLLLQADAAKVLPEIKRLISITY